MPTPHVYEKVIEKVDWRGCINIKLEDGTHLTLPPDAWSDGNKIELQDRMLIDFYGHGQNRHMVKVFRSHHLVTEFMLGGNCLIWSPALE